MEADIQSQLDGINFSRLLPQSSAVEFLRSLEDETKARITKSAPVTPEERFAAFKLIGFKPNGLYMPSQSETPELYAEARRRLNLVYTVSDKNQRERAYLQLQLDTETWQREGVPGHWVGQQAIARSRARYRLVAFGRRGGKSQAAASEACGLAILRPGFRAWLCAPTMHLVDRMWEYVKDILQQQMQIDNCRTYHDSETSKLAVLENGSKIEGVSVENVWSMAGEQIDLAVLDEAAQVTEDVFTRGLLPPLADRNGSLLLISTFEGQGDFFQGKAEECELEFERLKGILDITANPTEAAAVREALSELEQEWQIFTSPSYDINPYAFPQGRETPILRSFEKQMDPETFLEQFGSIPAGQRERVYPEFQERVHVASVPFDPNQPVVLTVDPSATVSPYAVLAIQDYGWDVRVIDELAETGMSVEKVSPLLKQREWISNVRDVIIDADETEDVIRWCNLGWPARPCPQRPGIAESIPLWSKMLRDPGRFLTFHEHKRQQAMEAFGYSGLYNDLSTRQQREIVLWISERLNGQSLAKDDLEGLRFCSRVMIDRKCVLAIDEHKKYSYAKRRRIDVNYRSVPKDFANHTMDALRYYVWATKRFEEHLAASDLAFKPHRNEWSVDPADPAVSSRLERITMLGSIRAQFKPERQFTRTVRMVGGSA